MAEHEDEFPVRALDRAMTLYKTLVDGVGPEDWDRPTPCPEWTVRDLVRHVATGNRQLATALCDSAKGPAEASPDAVEDPAKDFAASVQPLLDALAAPGALQRTVTVPFGTVPVAVAVHLRTTEAVVHGWDLARATGQALDVPEDLAETELAFSRAALAALPPGRSPFAPSQPVTGDAPGVDRLAGLLGRRVPWSSEFH